MCVYPGITTPKTSSARARIASLTLAISRTISSIESRRYRRRSSATWSFLLLPVCSFPPIFPSRRVRNCSTAMWTSSWERSNEIFPASISSRMAARAAAILLASPCGMIFCFPSIRACAMLPSMSCRYRRTSWGIEAGNSSTNASICPSNLPLHAFFFFAMSALPVLQHRPDLEPERVDLHEPFRVALVEHRLLLEGGEIGPVEGYGACPSRDDAVPLVQLEARRSGHVLLGLLHHPPEKLHFRGVPIPVVDELGVLGDQRIPEMHHFPVERDRLDGPVRDVEDGRSGGLVHPP